MGGICEGEFFGALWGCEGPQRGAAALRSKVPSRPHAKTQVPLPNSIFCIKAMFGALFKVYKGLFRAGIYPIVKRGEPPKSVASSQLLANCATIAADSRRRLSFGVVF